MGKRRKEKKIICYSCQSYGGPSEFEDYCEKGHSNIFLTPSSKRCPDYEQYIFKKDEDKKKKRMKISSDENHYCEVYK